MRHASNLCKGGGELTNQLELKLIDELNWEPIKIDSADNPKERIKKLSYGRVKVVAKIFNEQMDAFSKQG